MPELLYVIKIVYTGDKDVLTGEPLVTYFNYNGQELDSPEHFKIGNIFNYRYFFTHCVDKPSLFECKIEVQRIRESIQDIFDYFKDTAPIADRVEAFTRVCIWNEAEYRLSINETNYLKNKLEIKKRVKAKHLYNSIKKNRPVITDDLNEY